MKYIAILETENELPEEVIEDIKGTTFVGDFPSSYRCTISNINKAPEQAKYDSFWGNFHYNQALKDCGVIEE